MSQGDIHIPPIATDTSVTGYVFTDIEGSTRRWENLPDRMLQAMAEHNAILDAAVAAHGGKTIAQNGDGIFAVFPATDPIGFALQVQLEIQARNWNAIGGLTVRIGIHLAHGSQTSDIDPVAANRAARIADAAWGGQIVISADALAVFALPDACDTSDLGKCKLRDISEPIHLLSISHSAFRRQEFPPLRTLSSHHLPLPIHSTSFAGRGADIAALKTKFDIAGARFITIIGPAGNGKSRLAQHYGELRATDEFVGYVSLAGIDSDIDLRRTFATALNLPVDIVDTDSEQLVKFLNLRRSLLILDDADDLAGKAEWLSTLIDRCPDTYFLVTSREPLQAAGETIYTLSGLDFDSTQPAKLRESDAYRMFENAAKRVSPEFAMHDADVDHLLTIFKVLDGSPLGLELAAQWVHLTSLPDLSRRLSESLSLLDETPAQQARSDNGIASILALSWDRLTTHQRDALLSLSIFADSFTEATAEKVTSTPLRRIAALETKSLLTRTQSGRLCLHPLVLRFAREKRARDPQRFAHLPQAHMDVCFEKIRFGMSGRDPRSQGQILDELEEDWADLKAAWHTALRSDALDTLRNCSEQLYYFAVLRSKQADSLDLYQTRVANPAIQHYFNALLASCNFSLGNYDLGESLSRSALAATDPLTAAHANHTLGNITHARGDLHTALDWYRRGRTLREEIGDLWGLNTSDSSIASALIQLEDFEAARWHVRRSYESATQVKNAAGLLISHLSAGAIAEQENRLADAITNYKIGLELEADTRSPQLRIPLLVRLADVLLQDNDLEAASRCQIEAIDLNGKIGDKRQQARLYVSLAAMRRRSRDFRGARDHVCSGIEIGRNQGSKTLQLAGLMELARIDVTSGHTIRAREILTTLSGFDLGPDSESYRDLALKIGWTMNSDAVPDGLDTLVTSVLRARGTDDLLL